MNKPEDLLNKTIQNFMKAFDDSLDLPCSFEDKFLYIRQCLVNINANIMAMMFFNDPSCFSQGTDVIDKMADDVKNDIITHAKNQIATATLLNNPPDGNC